MRSLIVIIVTAVFSIAAGACVAAQSIAWSGAVLTANESGHSISIVDAATWRVRQTLALSMGPHNVQTSADRRYVYATANKEMDMKMPGMDMSRMSEMDMEMMEPGYLLAFDLQHLQGGPMLSVPVGMHAAHVVADEADRFAYVTVSGENAVKVVDLTAKAVVATIPVGKMPHGLRMSSDGKRLYVSNMDEGTVSIVDVAARKEIARVPVGKSPVQVAIAPDGRTVYATLAGENAVAVLDTASEKLVATIPVGPNPAQLFIAPDGKRLYVANQGTKPAPGHTVSVIDTASRRVVASVDVPAGAHGVVVTPDGSHVFVTDAFDSKLTEIDTATLNVRSIDVGKGPNGVTLAR